MEKQADAYIQLNHIVKRFGKFTALDHVSLTIPKGTFVTLLGPSGCGKTTLMRQIAGFSEPDEGDVIIDGNRMNGLPPYKRNTPLVFQEYALFPHMTVYENISYGLRLKKLPKEEISRKVADMLEMFNLTGLEGRFPKEMSGGQQQRVAFARALIMPQSEVISAGLPAGRVRTHSMPGWIPPPARLPGLGFTTRTFRPRIAHDRLSLLEGGAVCRITLSSVSIS